MNTWIKKESDNSISITVRVIPNSKQSTFIIQDPIPKIKIHEPAVEGAANRGLIKYLSRLIKVSRTNISIVKGENKRLKQLMITGIDEKTFLSRLPKE